MINFATSLLTSLPPMTSDLDQFILSLLSGDLMNTLILVAYGALCSPISIACEELFLSFCTANLFIANFIDFDFVIKIFYSTYMFIEQKRLFGTNILLYVNLYRAKVFGTDK